MQQQTEQHPGKEGAEVGQDSLDICIPRRSLPASRRLLSMYLALATGMALLVCMLLPAREQVFVPGELSHKHAQILDNTLVSERCSLCHPSSHGSRLMGTGFNSAEAITAQDALCMKCHNAHIPRGDERLAHDLPSDLLRNRLSAEALQMVAEAIADKAPGGRFVSLGKLPESPSDQTAFAPDTATMTWSNQTSCAWCHQEHHGRQSDLKLITDARCQACHRQQFESFSAGHPEFTAYPQPIPRTLAFTHTSHRDKHFPQKNKSFECRTCHVDGNHPSGVGPVSRSLGFDRTCAECHAEPIRSSMLEGWAVLAIPSIEPSDTKQDLKLADWPTSAQFGYEGTVSPILRALLAADGNVQAALRKLPAGGRLSEVPQAKRAEVARTIASATARLIQEISQSGQPAWRKRLELLMKQALEREVNSDEQKLLDRLTRDISPDLFRAMKTKWFAATNPSGAGRVSDIQSQPSHAQLRQASFGTNNPPGGLLSDNDADSLLLGEPPTKPGNTGSTKETNTEFKRLKGVEHLQAGGWYLDPDTLSLMRLPVGHADPTLAAWHEWQLLVASTKLGQDLGFATPDSVVSGNTKPMPGSCTQCHTMTAGTPVRSTWSASRRSPLEKPFTKFNHSPHLSLPAIRDCRHCHALGPANSSESSGISEQSELASAAIHGADGVLVSTLATPEAYMHQTSNEFRTMQLSQCNACHRSGGAGQGCTQCHNYHIRPPE